MDPSLSNFSRQIAVFAPKWADFGGKFRIFEAKTRLDDVISGNSGGKALSSLVLASKTSFLRQNEADFPAKNTHLGLMVKKMEAMTDLSHILPVFS